MTQSRTDLEPSQSAPVGEASGPGEGEGWAGRQAWAPPTTSVRAGKVRKEPIVQLWEAGPVGGHSQEDPSGQGGAGAFTQVVNGLFLSFQTESRANRFLQAGRQKKGAAWRRLETQVQEAKGSCALSQGCRNPRPGPPCQGSPRMPFVTCQVVTGVGVGLKNPPGSALKWFKRKNVEGTSLAVQGLRLHTSNEGSKGSIPGWGTRILILQAAHRGQKMRNEKKFFFLIKEAQIKKEKRWRVLFRANGELARLCFLSWPLGSVCEKGHRMKAGATSTT